MAQRLTVSLVSLRLTLLAPLRRFPSLGSVWVTAALRCYSVTKEVTTQDCSWQLHHLRTLQRWLKALNATSLRLAFALMIEILMSLLDLSLTDLLFFYVNNDSKKSQPFLQEPVGTTRPFDRAPPTWGRPDLLSQASFRDLRPWTHYRDSLDKAIDKPNGSR